MIPRFSQRFWIIVSWYLLFKCLPSNIPPVGVGALGSENHRKLQANHGIDHFNHRILDNSKTSHNSVHRKALPNEATSIEASHPARPQLAREHSTGSPPTYRRRTNVAYANLDNVLNSIHGPHGHEHIPRANDVVNEKPSVPVTPGGLHNFQGQPHLQSTPDDKISDKFSRANPRHRRSVADKDAMENSPGGARPFSPDSSALKSVWPGVSSTTSSSGDVFFSSARLETAGDVSLTTAEDGAVGDGSRRFANSHSRGQTRTLRTDDKPAVIDSLKASNLDQRISGSAPVVRTKLDPPTGAPESAPTEAAAGGRTFTTTEVPEKPVHPLSRLASGPQERPITASHATVTSDSSHNGGEQPDPPGAGGPGFILLDDSVYISPGHRNGSRPGPGADLTLDPNGPLFRGRNFDEQIIFLNGPDLLETSVERDRPAGQMGKVPRAVRPYDGEEPLALPLRPIVRDPADERLAEENVVVVYADQHETVRLNCEVDADITTGVWLKDGQIVHAMDKKSRTADIRFVRESFGALTISDVMLEDDGVWQCEAENARGFFFNGRPIKLIVLDPPKEPYLLIDSRRLDAGNMFIPVKENSELTLACVSEGGNPRPTLTWEVLLSPGIDRHAQKLSTDVLELQEIKKDKDVPEPYRINSGAISEVKLAAVFRVHHNARILCIMEHPTLKVRQNASILLDVQYTPSFAITRTPGFGYPLREGIEVSLKCDVDSNPPSTPLWQKDDGDPPVPQTGDGFLNFTSIRREHSGWYKCTSRHLNFQYSSIGYYLSVRYEPVDVTSEPVEQDLSLSPASSSSSASSLPASSSASSATFTNGAGSPWGGSSPGGSPIGPGSFKGGGQMEVELGGSVTLQCPQGSLGCWSHLDSATGRLKGPGSGSYAQTGQLSLKDVVYQDAGTYKCVGQGAGNRKRLEGLQTDSHAAKGPPTVIARNSTPVVLPGTPLHLSVEFCSNPPPYAARWLHGDRIYLPGNQYGTEVFAYGLVDLPTPYCKEARLTYVHMHEKVSRTVYFVVSSPGGVAEVVFKVNLTLGQKPAGSGTSSASPGSHGGSVSSSSATSSSGASGTSNVNGGLSGYKIGTLNTVPGNGLDDDEKLMEPEEIHFPIFGTGGSSRVALPVTGATFTVRLLGCVLHALPLWRVLRLPAAP